MSHKFPFIIAFLFFIVMAPCVDAYGVEKFPQDSEEVFFIAVGDIMLSRNVAQKIKNRDDINYPFLKMKDYLQEGDIVFGNLESPITPGREISDH